MLCGACVLAVSLYSTQILNGNAYVAKADKQYVKPAVTLFDRGTIFMQSKDDTNVSAATVYQGYLIFMNPTLVISGDQAYQVLSQYIKLDKADFLRRAAKAGDHYEELAHHVTADTAQTISSLGITGIGVTKETWRSYPAGNMSAQTIGLIGQTGSCFAFWS